MSVLTQEPTGPLSSGEIQKMDPEQALDVDRKHRLVADFLEDHGYDALLIQKPENFSWFTSGGDCSRQGSSETTAALFITPEARVVVCCNVDSSWLFERELSGLGFQLKERPWHEPRHVLLQDLCRGRTVAGDTGFSRTRDVSDYLTRMRLPLSDAEIGRLRELGKSVTHCVEATGRNLEHGQSEAEIAGQLAHRMIKRQIIPERIQVLADGQCQRYRHAGYGDDSVERYCIVSAIGRRWGLCVGTARTVCFGKPPGDIQDAHQKALLIQSTGMYFSRAEWELYPIWDRVQRIYEKFDCADEWRLADQGALIGYKPCEIPVVPKSEFRLTGGMPLHWFPSVGPALTGDTVLVRSERAELITPSENWPQVKVQVKGTSLERPTILQREE